MPKDKVTVLQRCPTCGHEWDFDSVKGAQISARHWAQSRSANPELIAQHGRDSDNIARLVIALRELLPLAEDYLKNAPTHPGHAAIKDARQAIRQARD